MNKRITIRDSFVWLALQLTALTLFTILVMVGRISAQAVLDGDVIEYNGVQYTNGGVDTRPDSSISGWTIYLPPNFTCGDNVIVDNPDTTGTVALRDTIARDQPTDNPVIGDCMTLNITSDLDCYNAGGVPIRGVGCSVGGRERRLELTNADGSDSDDGSGGAPSVADPQGDCLAAGGEWDEGFGCRAYQSQTNDCQGETVDSSNCQIMSYLVIFINVLSAVAGVVIVGSIVAGGIQYSAAGSDPSKVSAAKGRIRNAIIALLFFLFGYSVLNWLVPGGIF